MSTSSPALTSFSRGPRADNLAPTRDMPGPSLPANRLPSLHLVLNTVLAAALVLAVATGIWRASGGWLPGGGGTDIPLGGFVNQESTPVAGSVDPALLPQAEDCTVEPLTVDEVLWYTQAPEEAERSRDIAHPASPTPEFVPATPPATDPATYYQGPARPEHIAAIDAQQRMLMACIMADSWFQIWALEYPSTVSEQVMRVVPPLAGVEEARSILEDLEANGPSPASKKGPAFFAPSQIGYSGLPASAIAVIETDPLETWQIGNELDGAPSAPGTTLITTGYTVYQPDRTFVTRHALNADDPMATDDCRSFRFIWNEPRQTWLFLPALTCA